MYTFGRKLKWWHWLLPIPFSISIRRLRIIGVFLPLLFLSKKIEEGEKRGDSFLENPFIF